MEGPHYFDDDAYTDMPEKELVAEVIREKALLSMRDNEFMLNNFGFKQQPNR